MNEVIARYPNQYIAIDHETKALGFTMASDPLTCSLLKTLAVSKPNGKFLELGTGTGLSTSWILEGMNGYSSLVSIDHDPALIEVAQKFLGHDKRLSLVLSDGEAWITKNRGQKYDYIFADTWHGKYLMLDEVLAMLNIGGLYIIDDMIPQPNWPEGHHEKALKLVSCLESREDLILTKMVWATGIIIAVKR
jgi:predicted O-methyltransferase YrrM